MIGGLAASADVATFQVLLWQGMFRPLATTVGFSIAVCIHFTLNKIWTFKSYQRPVAHQFRTYAVVMAVALLVTQIVIEGLVRGFHVQPIVAKLVAIVVQIPISFFGHRYLTFGVGLSATLRAYRRKIHGEVR